MIVLKCCTQYVSKSENPAKGLEKISFHPSSKECQALKDVQLPDTSLTSHANKVNNIFQARLQQYLIENFQTYKLDLGKAEEPEIKLPQHSLNHIESKGTSKTSNSLFPLTTYAF